MTPEEQLAKILKQNQNVVFGKTIGTDADGNCTVQTDNGAILARSGGQISAGDCVAMQTDDGQWYAISSRPTGSINKKSLFERKNKPETKTETTGAKILFRVGSNVFVGGDREIPEQIYTVPNGFEIEKANISASGLKTDDWVAQIVLRSTAVMDAYRLSKEGTIEQKEANSFFLFYLNNRSTFVDSLRLVTVSPDITKEIKDTGVKVSRDTNTSTFLFVLETVLQGQRSIEEPPFIEQLGFYVREAYEVDPSNWSFTAVSRTCDVIGGRGFFTVTPLGGSTKAIAETIRLTLLATSLPVYSWKTPSDAGLGNTHEGFAFTISSSGRNLGEWLLLNVEIGGFGWWYSFDTVSLSFLLESAGSRTAEPYTWRDQIVSSRDEVSFFSGLSGVDDLFRSGNLFNGFYWMGFFCGFDGKLDNLFLPLTTRRLSITSQIDITSVSMEQRYTEIGINVSSSRSFLYSAIINPNFSGSVYFYPISRLSFSASLGFSPYAVFSYQSTESYILQGVEEETQLIKNNANNIGSSQLFDLYVNGETKIVACPFRASQLNGEEIFGAFEVDLDALAFRAKGYKLNGIVIPSEIVTNGINSKTQEIKSIDDNAVLMSASIFLDIESYDDLPDA